MSSIERVIAREILDSRGNPTIEVEVFCDDGHGRAAVPSGASTGEHEAVELRDGDKKRYVGKGVQKAVRNAENVLGQAIIGMDALDQSAVDKVLRDADGTPNKGKLGANAILGVSMAVARAAADVVALPLWRYIGGAQARVLPTPMMNILNGGVHADSGLEVQEFMVVPHAATSFAEGLRAGVEVFHALKAILKEEKMVVAVGDEGGFAPRLASNEAALEHIVRAIEAAGYKPGEQISIALDAALSEFYDAKTDRYTFDRESRTREQMVDTYKALVARFPIVSIEDGFDQNDDKGWKAITDALGASVQLVGDDLFVTSPARLEKGMREGIANAILVKLNQIGTVTETLDCIRTAQNGGYKAIISHRSGETEDTFIADLAVGTNAGQIKTGSASRTDRVAKYNQLLRIAYELGEAQIYAGKSPYRK